MQRRDVDVTAARRPHTYTRRRRRRRRLSATPTTRTTTTHMYAAPSMMTTTMGARATGAPRRRSATLSCVTRTTGRAVATTTAAARGALARARGATVVAMTATSAEARAVEAQAWIDAWKAGAGGASSGGAELELRRSTSRALAEGEGGSSLSTTSFGTIGLGVGLPLLAYGFCAYFQFLPGSDVSALMLIYGFPISLIGFALKYAELEPLECITYADALKLREEQTTSILTQVRNDVTRFRYGDEQHLEEALKIVFRFNRPGGLRRNQAPELVGLSEQVINDRYSLCLVFDSPKMEFSDWTERLGKITGFFGPGVVAAATQLEGSKVEIALITTGSGGGGEMEDMEVLPPLMPGLPARYVKRGTA